MEEFPIQKLCSDFIWGRVHHACSYVCGLVIDMLYGRDWLQLRYTSHTCGGTHLQRPPTMAAINGLAGSIPRLVLIGQLASRHG